MYEQAGSKHWHTMVTVIVTMATVMVTMATVIVTMVTVIVTMVTLMFLTIMHSDVWYGVSMD